MLLITSDPVISNLRVLPERKKKCLFPETFQLLDMHTTDYLIVTTSTENKEESDNSNLNFCSDED